MNCTPAVAFDVGNLPALNRRSHRRGRAPRCPFVGGARRRRPRTRCAYFRDVAASCNKRAPGSGCAALRGYNRAHAILGPTDACVAAHPSDVAVAFAALEATMLLLGPDGECDVTSAGFLLWPRTTPDREHGLRPGELITAVKILAHPRPLRSGYLKVRDRQTFKFALTSAAVALHLQSGVIRAARSPWAASAPSHGSCPRWSNT